MHLMATLISIGNSTKQSKSSSAVIPRHGASTMHAHHVNIRCAWSLFPLYVHSDHFQLGGESPLNPSILGALDGNNSLKWFARVKHQANHLNFDSDYFISQEYVDQFKHEVKCKVKTPENAKVSPTHPSAST